jgi:ferredoxin
MTHGAVAVTTGRRRTRRPAMRIVVDWDRCTGMGMCESLAPDVFEVDDDGSLILHTEEVSQDQEAEVREAVAACPTEALSLEGPIET